MITLYHHNLSVCSQKVRLLLEEKKLPWKGRFVDLVKGEHLQPEFLKINPRALVPTITHGDVVVIESTVILEYLEDAFPESSFRPSDPALRAQMRVWTKLPDDGLHTACATISFASAFAKQLAEGLGEEELQRRLASMPDQDRASRQRTLMKEGLAAPFVRQAVAMYERVLDEMDGALKKNGPWLVGKQFTLADMGLVPYVERMHRLGYEGFWQERRPYVRDWFDRNRERPSYKAAFDAFKPVGYDDLLREKGINLWPKLEPLLRKDARVAH